MTPFWRPLEKGTMQIGYRMLLTTITQVFHVPKLKNSFNSVNKLISEGLKVEFDKDGCKVNNPWNYYGGSTKGKKNLYLFNVNIRKENVNVAKFSNEGTTLWHEIFSHLNMANLKKLEKMVNGI